MVSSCCHSNKAINSVYFNIHGIKVHHFKIMLDWSSSKSFYIPKSHSPIYQPWGWWKFGTFIFTSIWWNLCIGNWRKQNSLTKSQSWNNCSSANIIKLGHWEVKNNYKSHRVWVWACTLNKRELPHEYHNTIKKCNYQDCLLMLQQPCARKEFDKWVIIYLLFSPIMLVPLHFFLSFWTIFQLVKYMKKFDNYKINVGQWHEDFVVFWQYIIKKGVSLTMWPCHLH
jgi:hypothetical protein